MAETTLPKTLPDNNNLLQALIAAVRWKASYDEDYPGDDVHLCTISQWMQKLINSNNLNVLLIFAAALF